MVRCRWLSRWSGAGGEQAGCEQSRTILTLAPPPHLSQWRVALELLEEMELYGLPNTANAFTAASSACGSMRTRAPNMHSTIAPPHGPCP